MVETVKRLGAITVTANTDTALYLVGASTSAVVSTIQVCNIGSTDRTFRIAHVNAGGVGAVANEDYLYYDCTIEANSSASFTLGIAMATADTLLVRANHAEVVFLCWGVEIT